MKMIISIMQGENEKTVTEELNKAGFMVTKLASTGGFLKQKNSTILVGTEDEKVEKAITIIKHFAGTTVTKTYSSTSMGDAQMVPGTDMLIPVEVRTGGCTIFVVDVENFIKA